MPGDDDEDCSSNMALRDLGKVLLDCAFYSSSIINFTDVPDSLNIRPPNSSTSPAHIRPTSHLHGIYLLPLAVPHKAVFIRACSTSLGTPYTHTSSATSRRRVASERYHRRAGPVVKMDRQDQLHDRVCADHRRHILAARTRRGQLGHIDASLRVCDSTHPRPVHRSRWPSASYSMTKRGPSGAIATTSMRRRDII